MDSYVNFANENNYYYLVSTLARHRVSLPYPETEKDDNDTAVFFEVGSILTTFTTLSYNKLRV